MKALSIRQPWAHAILHCGKDVENREWKACHYRGLFLIHAAKGCTRDEFEDGSWAIREITGTAPPALSEMPRGCVVGMARIVGAVQDTRKVSWFDEPEPDYKGSAWGLRGTLHIQLADVVMLPAVPFKGALGFFEVTKADLGEHAEAYVEAARRLGGDK